MLAVVDRAELSLMGCTHHTAGDVHGGAGMKTSESLYWRLIQGELRCPTCHNFKVESKDKGIPCDKFMEFEGTLDSPFRVASTARPKPVE